MITLRNEQGVTRQIEEGKPYMIQPGEFVSHGTDTTPEESQLLNTLSKLAQSRSIPYGDYIAKVTAALRIPHCSKCEQKRLLFNRFHELGVFKTLRLLKEIR